MYFNNLKNIYNPQTPTHPTPPHFSNRERLLCPPNFKSWIRPWMMMMLMIDDDNHDDHDHDHDDHEDHDDHHHLIYYLCCRLVLLLHATSRYMDQMLAMNRGGSSQQSTEHSSIGLIAAKYWSKMIHSYTTMQQLQSEVSTSNKQPELGQNWTMLPANMVTHEWISEEGVQK